MEECFDVMWYVSLCLDAAGFSMEEAMERGIAKLRARYPNGFTEEAALNRDLVKERTELERR
jgi:NTP pyrophosphatase (non-canonical NTP hydrolase)